LAQASGGYVQGPTTTLPPMTHTCRLADVNLDGKQDLVCIHAVDTEGNAEIAVLLGNGDGSFQSPIFSGQMQTCEGCVTDLYTPADLNNDSFPDLIVGPGALIVLLGDGTGHFNVSYNNIVPGMVPNGGEMFAADLNGDGKPDLLGSAGPEVWLGNGDGTFQDGVTYGNYYSCNLYDIEADGHPDAICALPFPPVGRT